jgi:hypothetical protein
MSDTSGPDSNKTDWSRVEARVKAKQGLSPGSSQVPSPITYGEGDPDHSIVPASINLPTPETDSQRGILHQWRLNKIDRKTALEAIQARYDAQLDALRYQLQKAVTVSNARADRIAEEFLKKLDAEHMEVLTDLGLRNAANRADALIKVREMIVSKLCEVQSKNWPQSLLDRAIDDILELERRVCAEMMKELGT